jgi:hypothetical protein
MAELRPRSVTLDRGMMNHAQIGKTREESRAYFLPVFVTVSGVADVAMTG